jgi:hypothetical protein
MVTVGITKAITNLNEAHARLGVSPSPDANFFTEWRDDLPSLTEAEKNRLDHLKQRYLYYADSGAVTEGTVNLILLAPLLETLGLIGSPYQVRSEKYVRFELEDGETQQYRLSDKFTLSTVEGNELSVVAQILKRLVGL